MAKSRGYTKMRKTKRNTKRNKRRGGKCPCSSNNKPKPSSLWGGANVEKPEDMFVNENTSM